MSEEIQNIKKNYLNVIDASPTKELFINILVKDIELKNSILDLIDNSVDGALKVKGEKSFVGLEIRLEISENEFRIVDNCGGMPVDVAREYAFRFGRPEDISIDKLVSGTIGEFGVGMKRTLFKLGNEIFVKSVHKNSSFSMEIDVENWKKEKGDWEFQFKEFQEGQKNPKNDWGTEIIVKGLYPEISQEIKEDKFVKELRQDIEIAHVKSLQKGLVIIVNQLPARIKPLKLKVSKRLPVAYREEIFRVGEKKEDIRVKIYAGVSDSDPNEAGWYIFCNGRVVLSANQLEVTGWGTERLAPRFHNQYAMFRGYVFFDAENTGLLPWNTTKTGINEEVHVYKAVKLQMLSIMKTIISFLNELDREKTALKQKEMEEEYGPISVTVNKAKPKNILNMNISNFPKSFKPKIPKYISPPQGSEEGMVRYFKPRTEIEKLKKIFKVRSAKEVGEKTFEYFYNSEVADD